MRGAETEKKKWVRREGEGGGEADLDRGGGGVGGGLAEVK